MNPDGISRRTLLTAASLGVLVALAGCSAVPRQARLRIACGEPGGIYIRFGKLLAAAAVDAGIAAEGSAMVTEGSSENLSLLAAREVELGISLADSAASDGGGLVAVGRVYQNYLQCVVRADSTMHTIDDLASARVSIGALGSGTALTSRRVLDALGIWPALADADRILQLRLADAAAALEARSIDAFFWSGGLPTPEIESLRTRIAIRLLDVATVTPHLNAVHDDVYQHTFIPAGVYDLAEDTPTLGVSNFLMCHATLPDPTAAALVDVLIDRSRDLVPEPSSGVQYLTQPNLVDTSPIPLHPAVAARYAERYG